MRCHTAWACTCVCVVSRQRERGTVGGSEAEMHPSQHCQAKQSASYLAAVDARRVGCGTHVGQHLAHALRSQSKHAHMWMRMADSDSPWRLFRVAAPRRLHSLAVLPSVLCPPAPWRWRRQTRARPAPRGSWARPAGRGRQQSREAGPCSRGMQGEAAQARCSTAARSGSAPPSPPPSALLTGNSARIRELWQPGKWSCFSSVYGPSTSPARREISAARSSSCTHRQAP